MRASSTKDKFGDATSQHIGIHAVTDVLYVKNINKFGKFLTGLLCISLLSILIRECVAAPIRAFAPAFWYLPDGMLILSLLMMALIGFARAPINIIIITLILLMWVLASLISLTPESVIVGSRPLLVGLGAFLVARIASHWTIYTEKILGLLLIISIFGIFYDRFVGYSWGDQQFQGLLGESDVVRNWWRADSLRRISGMGISSTESAIAISCLCIYVVFSGRIQSKLICSVLFATSTAAIWLTTQRATLACFIFVFTFYFLGSFILSREGRRGQMIIAKLALLLASITCVVTPLLIYEVDIRSVVGDAAETIFERTFYIWPTAIDRITNSSMLFFGGGIGATGAPMAFTDPSLATPPDNMFLYLFMTVGISSVPIVMWAIIRALRCNSSVLLNLPAILTLSFLCLNGITANILGGITGVSFLFFSIGVASRHGLTGADLSLRI